MSTRNLDALLRPAQVAVLGEAVGASARTLAATLRQARPDTRLIEDLHSAAGGGALPPLVVLGDPALGTAAAVQVLAAGGCRALIWPHGEAIPPDALDAALQRGLRVLGPRSPGVLRPALNLPAAALPAEVPSGSLALIVQSHSVAAAAVDWAAGRRLGFSWAAVTGAEGDVDVGDLLDYAALDPSTHGVVLQLGHLKNARKFMSAARACARGKPVAVLQTQPGDVEPVGRDRVRSAAFARAGMIECRSLPELFDAIAGLERMPAQQRARVLVAANGSGICALGVDALRRERLTMANIAEATWQRVRSHLPQARWLAGAVDLGDAGVAPTVAALSELLADDGLDLLLFIRSPVGESPHEAFAEALPGVPRRERLLTVWLGLHTAAPARSRCAEARIATFTSPDAAARAVRHRRDYVRNRELLTQTPPADPTLDVDAAITAARLTKLVYEHVYDCQSSRAAEVLSSYGVESVRSARPESLQLDVEVRRHAELGLHLAVRLPGSPRTGFGFPPLDPLLSQRTLADAGVVGAVDEDIAETAPSEDIAALGRALTRIGQLVMDQPLIAGLQLRLVARRGEAVWLRGRGRLSLSPHPLPARERLVLAPYPEQLCHSFGAGDARYRVRAVKPSDEPRVIALLESLDPEAVRMRFFHYIRHFSHAMAARMTQVDYDRELALVIMPEPLRDPAQDERMPIIAMGTLVANADNTAAEFAVLVHGGHVGRGLGRHLLAQFVEHAQRSGIREIFGETLTENHAMQAVARKLGFECHVMADDPGCVHMQRLLG